jgi:DNA-binding NarL/FixJ family response regulator
VLVVAAYPAVRAGLRAMLESAAGIAVARESTPAVLLSGDGSESAEVLVVDLGDESRATIGAIDDLFPQTPAVLLAGDPHDFPEPGGVPAPRAYLLRDATADEISASVQAVARGLIVLDPAVARAVPVERRAVFSAAVEEQVEPLTEREREVLGLLALGLPNKAIALRLGISDHTVKFHVGAILAKLGAAGRTEAVMLAARRGLLPL